MIPLSIDSEEELNCFKENFINGGKLFYIRFTVTFPFKNQQCTLRKNCVVYAVTVLLRCYNSINYTVEELKST
jgi:hypothetical protein